MNLTFFSPDLFMSFLAQAVCAPLKISCTGDIYEYFPQCLNLPKGSEKPVSGLWDRICPLQQISHQYKLVGAMKVKKKQVFLIHEVRSSRQSSAWMERMICGLKDFGVDSWVEMSGSFLRYLLPSRGSGGEPTGDMGTWAEVKDLAVGACAGI